VKALLLGSGNSKKRRINGSTTCDELVTLDIDPCCKPDIVYDLNELPYPFEDGEFDEIHAYEVLEHLGAQGDYKFFFEQWNEFHRIIKPNGWFCGSVPSHETQWAWGDPGHTRVITHGTLSFLSESSYENIGTTPRTDYRALIKGYWKIADIQYQDGSMFFLLQRV
jgi:hypothetical protein